jgi:asparagine N-glycosylation enzyme membrane subunit Stt3
MKFPLLYLFSIVCFLLSLYLIKEHYSTEESSFCDVGTYFSCSKVNKSSWSVLFGVPLGNNPENHICKVPGELSGALSSFFVFC